MNKQKVAIRLAQFLLRYGRGNELSGFITARFNDAVMAGLAIDLINRIFGFELNLIMITALIVIFVPFVSYTLGYLDEKFGFWRVQNNYSSQHLNPYFEDKFKELNDKLNEIAKTKN